MSKMVYKSRSLAAREGVVMKKSLIALLALGALTLAPAVASADHRFGTDRGSRYDRGGYSGGRSRSYFDVSVGFGSGGYHRGGYSYSNFSFGRGRSYSPRYSYYEPCYRPSP